MCDDRKFDRVDFFMCAAPDCVATFLRPRVVANQLKIDSKLTFKFPILKMRMHRMPS